MRVLSSQQVRSVVRRYEAGERIRDICKRFGVTHGAIHGLLKHRGIPIRPRGTKWRYEVDEHFFDAIDTERKAYWLGVLAADGCIHPDHRTSAPTLAIQLGMQDAPWLHVFRNHIGSTHPVRTYGRSSRITITNAVICAALERHGIHPRKTFSLAFPTHLRADLVRHYIRGYSDGDGGFYRYADPKWPRDKIKWVVTGNTTFIAGLREVLVAKIPRSTGNLYVSPRNERTASLTYSGQILVGEIAEWLYADATVWLDRKRPGYLLRG